MNLSRLIRIPSSSQRAEAPRQSQASFKDAPEQAPEGVTKADLTVNLLSDMEADAAAWGLVLVDPTGTRFDRTRAIQYSHLRLVTGEVLGTDPETGSTEVLSSNPAVLCALLIARDLSDAAAHRRAELNDPGLSFADYVSSIDASSDLGRSLTDAICAAESFAEAIEGKISFDARMARAKDAASALKDLSPEQEEDLAAAVASLESEADRVHLELREADEGMSEALNSFRSEVSSSMALSGGRDVAASNELALSEIRRLATFSNRHGAEPVAPSSAQFR